MSNLDDTGLNAMLPPTKNKDPLETIISVPETKEMTEPGEEDTMQNRFKAWILAQWEDIKVYLLFLWDGLGFFGFSTHKLARLEGE